jgi:ActR/RegA family two-component response regulator
MGDPLSGHVVLIYEPEVGEFAHRLQAALERRGAETLAVHNPAEAFQRMREFSFSVGVVNCDHSCDALDRLIDGLSGISVLLYGSEKASAAYRRKAPHLACTHARVESILSALDRLLCPARH